MRIDELQQLVILESPLHGHGTDAPPAAVQAACGLLDGVALRIRGTGITVVQQNLTQVQHRRHTCAVLLDVSLQLLDEQHKRGFIRSKRINSTGLFLNASCVFVPAADPVSSGSPGSRRCRRRWDGTVRSQCGRATCADYSCSYPTAEWPLKSPVASSLCIDKEMFTLFTHLHTKSTSIYSILL